MNSPILEAIRDWCIRKFQPKGDYLTSIPSEYTTEIEKMSDKLNIINIGYGICSTAADIAAKEVTIINTEQWELVPGSEVTVKFDYTNTALNPTLNVNGTGAKSVIYDTTTVTTTNKERVGYKDRYIKYIYDGTQYVFIGWSIDVNTTYALASSSSNGLMSATDKDKLDGLISVPKDFVLINQSELTFIDNICTISDNRITADSLADVYFTNDTISIAEKAIITVETYEGKVELNAGKTPEGTIKASIYIRVV